MRTAGKFKLAILVIALADVSCGERGKEPQTRPRTQDGTEIVFANSKAKSPSKKSEPTATQTENPAPRPNSASENEDPHAGQFTLEQAVSGLHGKGSLTANIKTDLGTLQCHLYEDKAPITVANFVGLARGLRKFWDPRQSAWVSRPYYDGTTFHRVIPDFMIQGGDFLGNGTGTPGYTIPDELHSSLRHDRAGLLCMANRGPNTNGAQFFITDAAAPHLDHSYTIFGECRPLDVIRRIARVPQDGSPANRPLTPVVIQRVTIERKGTRRP